MPPDTDPWDRCRASIRAATAYLRASSESNARAALRAMLLNTVQETMIGWAEHMDRWPGLDREAIRAALTTQKGSARVKESEALFLRFITGAFERNLNKALKKFEDGEYR